MKIDCLEVAFLERSIASSRLAMLTTHPTTNEEIQDLYHKQLPIAQTLTKNPRGEGHDNFLHGIVVRYYLTASKKFWTEFQRYHFAEFVTSQSTMHRASQFDINISTNKYVTEEIKNIITKYKEEYNKNKTTENYMKLLYNLPSGFELTADIVTNYGQIKTMIKQRKNHRLQEWRDFCKFMEENLPLFKELHIGE